MRPWTEGAATGWLRTGGLIVVGALAVSAAAVAIGAEVWSRQSARVVAGLRDQLRAAPQPPDPTAFQALPPPVARYFAYAFAGEPPTVRSARVRWSGQFRMRPDAGWVPFTATQLFSVEPPGFVWDARIRMAPLLSVRVRDALVAGRASMLGRVAGLAPVVDQAGTTELAQSALGRWLGEAAWFPSALLPRDGIRWEPIDDSTSRVSVAAGPTSASAELHFADDGRLLRISSVRYRDVDGRAVPTPFEGTYRRYARMNGVMVPMEAEVAWLLPERRYAYWRGHPVQIRYACDEVG